MRVSYNDNGRVNNPPRAYFPEKPSRVPKLHMSLGRHLFIVTPLLPFGASNFRLPLGL